jgi:hypothetical protein
MRIATKKSAVSESLIRGSLRCAAIKKLSALAKLKLAYPDKPHKGQGKSFFGY